MEAAMGASLWTILAAAAAGWIFGAAWYMTLGRPWQKAAGITPEMMRAKSGLAMVAPFIISFLLAVVMAYVLATLFLHVGEGETGIGTALSAGFYLWLGFVATTTIVNYQFAMRPWTLAAIDGLHWLGVLLIQSAVIALLGL